MQFRALSIAGFDGSGGAGIQADLKTFSALGCYGMTVLTALPIQNTLGVQNCYELPIACIREQLAAIFDDLVPDAIKVGMLFSSEIVETVGAFLRARAKGIPIVVDPVMMAKSGDPLLKPDAIRALKEEILPLATLFTPNLSEAQALSGMEPNSYEDLPQLAKHLLAFGSKAVLVKGGHFTDAMSSDFLLTDTNTEEWFSAPRILTRNTHGTGCTLSAAIASGLAQGMDLSAACTRAKTYLTEALFAAKDMDIGRGHGPVHHFYSWWPRRLSGL